MTKDIANSHEKTQKKLSDRLLFYSKEYFFIAIYDENKLYFDEMRMIYVCTNLILYLFYEDYIQPEATSSSPLCTRPTPLSETRVIFVLLYHSG
jgi:hypothetical protein